MPRLLTANDDIVRRRWTSMTRSTGLASLSAGGGGRSPLCSRTKNRWPACRAGVASMIMEKSPEPTVISTRRLCVDRGIERATRGCGQQRSCWRHQLAAGSCRRRTEARAAGDGCGTGWITVSTDCWSLKYGGRWITGTANISGSRITPKSGRRPGRRRTPGSSCSCAAAREAMTDKAEEQPDTWHS